MPPTRELAEEKKVLPSYTFWAKNITFFLFVRDDTRGFEFDNKRYSKCKKKKIF